MKSFWVNIGVAFAMAAFLWIIGQIVATVRKEYLSENVIEQKNPIPESFDYEFLEIVYNKKDKVLFTSEEE
jgi:hypothetical protein